MANRVIEHIKLSNSNELFDLKDVIAFQINESVEELREELAQLQAKYDALEEEVKDIKYNGGNSSGSNNSGQSGDD